jgi:hypothetical protein
MHGSVSLITHRLMDVATVYRARAEQAPLPAKLNHTAELNMGVDSLINRAAVTAGIQNQLFR